MKPVFQILTIIAAMSPVVAAQRPSLPDPALPSAALEITHGPIVESVTDTTAIIAWSTNVNAGTMLHYGLDSNHLDQTAGMPWGGLTHRVELKSLRPGTKYFFRAESPHGQGTGDDAQGPVLYFQTKEVVH